MLYLLLSFLLINPTSTSQCGSAFALQIEDAIVDIRNPSSYMKGIRATVGTPPQNVMLLPWAELNNTYLYDQNEYCDPTVIYDNQTCFVRRGGLFVEAKSTTFEQTSDLVAAGGADQETSSDQAEFGIKSLIRTSLGGNDNLTFGSTPTLEAFPIGIPRQAWDGGYSTLNAWGLGTNSSYLNALYNTQKIASRVWSIYWGRMWTDSNPLNGSVVIGGYDKRKVQGRNYTQKLDYSRGCYTGLQVTITDIQLNPRGGDDRSLLNANSATAISTCIVPTRQLLFQGPPEVQDNFQRITGKTSSRVSFGVHWSAMVFDGRNIYAGDVTFTLSTGMQVRVTNDQFVTKSVYYADGSRRFNESSTDVLLGVVANQKATLGRYFLTAAYVMINHDEGTWTIWNANPTSSTSLETVFRAGSKCSNTSSTSTGDSNIPSASGIGSAGSPPTSLSGPTIAGIVVGVILILATLAITSCWLIYRKKHQSQPRSSPGPPTYNRSGQYELEQSEKLNFGSTEPSTFANQHGYGPAELHSEVGKGFQRPVFHELADRTSRFGLDGRDGGRQHRGSSSWR